MHHPRVFLQYNCIPHYRRAIFRRLCAIKDLEFTILADSEADTPYLNVVNNDPEIRHTIVRTLFLKIPKVPRFYWQWNAVRIVFTELPDCVIALGSPYSITAWALLVLGRVKRIPIMLWSQGLLKSEGGLNWLIRGTFYRLASALLVYGNHAKKLIANLGIDSKNVYVVYNSLDYENQARIAEQITPDDNFRRRTELGVRPGEGLVVFTGRLQPVKRLDLLIDAINDLSRCGKRVHLILVGEGSHRGKLTAQAKNLGISHLIHFFGESYDEGFLGRIFAAGDLCVVPSSAGLTIMHAMVYGCPVLLHDRLEMHGPEWEAVREGITGFYYRFGDKADLARKIEQAIFPEPKKLVMSHACRRMIRERYNPVIQEKLFVHAVLKTIKRRK